MFKIAELPANASRLFKTCDEAKTQSLGKLELDIHPNGHHVFNKSFDISKINYDLNYNTENTFHFQQTLEYFPGLSKFLTKFSRFTEIGCGQGEFVEYLRSNGFNAFGYDPVLRESNKYLFNIEWSLGEEENLKSEMVMSNTLYIMRCVLPHISDPFKFLDNIFEEYPDSAILIEFQNKEWIEQKKLWPQISHDHVNIFSKRDFEKRYTILNSGDFSNYEWTYVLLQRKIQSFSYSGEGEFLSKLLKMEDIFETRKKEISLLQATDRPIVIFGAAGKGIVAGFTLINEGVNVIYAIDGNVKHQGLYMECSGIRVITEAETKAKLSSKTIILIANPNHIQYVSKLYAGKFTLAIMGKITQKELNL
jgi:hypothetical protein